MKRVIRFFLLFGFASSQATEANAPDTKIAVDLHNGTIMEFVWIHPGTFWMGSSPSDPARGTDEVPRYKVEISKGFYLGKYEITQSQWAAIMGTAPWTGKKHVERHSSHPAVYISWTAVQEFLRRINDAAGNQAYRLPTEAEWEYACRAGTSSRRFFGEDESRLGDYAWFVENGPKAGLKYAQPVGEKLPNSWGLYDIYGNVWEWVQDWYSPHYPEGPQVDSTGPPSGTNRVMRGGGFVNHARNVRSAKRYSYEPSLRFSALGARLVKTLDE